MARPATPIAHAAPGPGTTRTVNVGAVVKPGDNCHRSSPPFCELLWRLWSPTWSRNAKRYPLSAPAFDNPDFVEVVIHSYRHRFMYAPGDPVLEWMEEALMKRLEALPGIQRIRVRRREP